MDLFLKLECFFRQTIHKRYRLIFLSYFAVIDLFPADQTRGFHFFDDRTIRRTPHQEEQQRMRAGNRGFGQEHT